MVFRCDRGDLGHRNVSSVFIGISVLGVDAVPIGTFTAFAMYLTMFWDPIQNLAGFTTS